MTFTQLVLWLTLLTNVVSLAVSFTLWRSVAQNQGELFRLLKSAVSKKKSPLSLSDAGLPEPIVAVKKMTGKQEA